MEPDAGRWYSRGPEIVGILVPLLLAVQFSSGVVLASMGLPSAALSFLTDVFEVYGVALALVLVGSIALLLRASTRSIRPTTARTFLVIQLAALAVWLASMGSDTPSPMKANFPILAAVAMAATAGLCPFLLTDQRRPMDIAWRWAYFVLLGLVPLVVAVRTAASFGIGTSPGPSGTLQGDWLLVNGPTIVLESFAIGMWLNLMWDPASDGLRRRWGVWLPAAAFILAVMGFSMSGLFAFVLSAFITWGTNLAVFVPVTVSLSFAAASIACYASFFLLLRARGSDRWKGLLLGTAALLLAGFYPSMVSVAGLSYGLLTTTFALSPNGSKSRPSRL